MTCVGNDLSKSVIAHLLRDLTFTLTRHFVTPSLEFAPRSQSSAKATRSQIAPSARYPDSLHSVRPQIRSPRWGEGRDTSYAFLASFLYSSIARIVQMIKQITPEANQKYIAPSQFWLPFEPNLSTR